MVGGVPPGHWTGPEDRCERRITYPLNPRTRLNSGVSSPEDDCLEIERGGDQEEDADPENVVRRGDEHSGGHGGVDAEVVEGAT